MDDSNQTTTYSVGAGLYAAADTLFVTETGHLEIKKQGRERDLVNNGDELGVSFWIKHKGKTFIYLFLFIYLFIFFCKGCLTENN